MSLIWKIVEANGWGEWGGSDRITKRLSALPQPLTTSQSPENDIIV